MPVDNDKVLAIFNEAKQLSIESQKTFLSEACGGDEELRNEVDTLLQFHSDSSQTILDVDSAIDYSTGDMIGPFKVLRKLGEGGFGVVYLAEQLEPVKRRVALKVIKPGMDTKRVIARFEAERQALAMMNHPGIAQVYEAGVTDRGLPYFAMEEVKGTAITSACDEQRFSITNRLELMIEVCNAVQHAHMKGIIHRDLKPSNILVYITEDGNLSSKIIDFGVAKATGYQLTEKTLATMEGRLIGTPAYMSPEQANPAATDIDMRSDVYSLGVVLYELLVGKQPFETASLEDAGYDEMRRIIREDDPPRPSTKLSSLSVEEAGHIVKDRQIELEQLSGILHSELEWIPLKAMRKLRHERYDSAKSLGDDIKRYLAKEPLEAGPQSTLYHVKKYIRRKKEKVIAASLISIALVAGITVSLIFAAQKARATKETQRIHEFMEDAITEVKSDLDLPSQSEPLRAIGTSRKIRDSAAIKHRLDYKVEMIENMSDPKVRARIAEAIGLTYSSIGVFREAEALLEGAIEFNENNYGEDAPSTLDSKMSMVALRKQQGRYQEAEKLISEVLEGRSTTNDRKTLEAKWWRGYLLMSQQKFSESEKYLQEAMDGYLNNIGEDDPHTPLIIALLGDLHFKQQGYRSSEQSYQMAIDMSEQHLGSTHPTHLHVLKKMGKLMMQQGKYADAEDIYRRVLKANEDKSEDSRETFDSYRNLGSLFAEQRRDADAEEMYRKAADGYRQTYKTTDPDTLEAIGDLGELYLDQYKFNDAREEFEDVLDSSRDLEPNHPSTLQALEWMGDLYQAQGKDTDASVEYKNSLDGHAKFFGDEHPKTLRVKSKIASLLEEQGKYAEAKTHFDQIFTTRTRVFGPEHEATVTALISIVKLHGVSDSYAETADMYQDAVDRYTEDYGDKHPQTMRLISTLASTLSFLEKRVEAEVLYRKVYESKEEVFGQEQLETLSAIVPLSRVLTDLGRYQEAEELLRYKLKTTTDVYGDAHPATLQSMVDLGEILVLHKNYVEADVILEEAMNKHEDIFGEVHSKTLLLVRSWGAWLNGDWKKYIKNDEMMRRNLNANLELFGEYHPQTVRARWWLASSLHRHGKFKIAGEQYDKAVQAAKRVYGEKHPETLQIMSGMARNFRWNGEYEPAEELYRMVLQANRELHGDSHSSTLDATIALASQVFVKNNKLDDAAEVLERALRVCRDHFGEIHSETALIYWWLGVVQRDRGEIAEASTYYSKAADIYRHIYGDHHGQTLNIAWTSAWYLEKLGMGDEGEKYLREVVGNARNILAIEDPQRLQATNTLGNFLIQRGNVAEAESLYLEELTSCTELLEDNHPRTLAELQRMGTFHYEQQKYDSAEIYLLKSLEGHQNFYGRAHPLTMEALSDWGQYWMYAANNPSKALATLEEIVQMYSSFYGPLHPRTSGWIMTQAMVLTRLDRHDEAEQLLLKYFARK